MEKKKDSFFSNIISIKTIAVFPVESFGKSASVKEFSLFSSESVLINPSDVRS